jgi:hypothetical protein
MPKASKSKKQEQQENSVPVSLEKAEERIRSPVAQVPEEIVAGIKNAQQIERETAASLARESAEADISRTRNKALFYVGVFAGVGALFLIHRYFFSSVVPDKNLIPQLANETVAIVTETIKE